MQSVLSNEDIQAIDREGERLKNEFSKLISLFPNNARSITGMCQWLSTNKSTCQRLIESINKTENGVDVVMSLPGPKGLRSFLDDAAKKNVDLDTIEHAKRATERFENLILGYGRSHATLKQKLKQSVKSVDSKDYGENSREQMFNAIASITGEQQDTIFYTCLLAENRVQPEFLQQYTVCSYQGCHMTENARPISFAVVPAENPINRLVPPKVVSVSAQPNTIEDPISILKEYSSEQFFNNESNIAVSEDSLLFPYRPEIKKFDATFYKNYPHEQKNPFYGGKHASCVSVQIRNPVKHLYMLCFLDRSFAMRSVANAGVYSIKSQPNEMLKSPDALWYDRFPEMTELSLFQPNIDFSSYLKYQKANDMVNSLFQLSGHDRKKFSCYVLKVQYPIWSTAYRIYFQYAID